MRLGILTFHHGFNYGGFLQVYALQEYLTSLGCDVQVINYANRRHLRRKMRNIMRLNHPLRFLKEVKRMMVFVKAHRTYLDCTERLRSCSDISKLGFDAVVLGSDEIWNFNNMMFGYDPCYFGTGFKAGRIIAYAASFGPRNLHERPPEQVSLALSCLDAISVRDYNSQVFVNRLTGRDAPLVADPTFLVDFEEKLPARQPGPYAILYGGDLEPRVFTKIRAYTRAHRLKLIALGYPHPGCDMTLESMTPFQFLGWLKNARIVFTGMFHGSVFSILYRRPFVFWMNAYRKNKVDHMFKRIGIHRVVSTEDEFDCIVNQEIDYETVFSEIGNYINESKEYIQNAIF